MSATQRLCLITLAVHALVFAGTTIGTGPGGPIPAGAFVTSGVVTSNIVLSGPGYVAPGNAITVTLLGLQHDFAGDLHITLSYLNSNGQTLQSTDLLNRIGCSTTNPYGTAADFGNNQSLGDNYIFNTDYTGNIWTAAACADPPACTEPLGDVDSIPGVSTDTINNGQYFTSTAAGAKTSLSYAFTGFSVSGGTWQLTIVDAADPNVGSFVGWQLSVTSVATPPPVTLTAAAGTPQSTTIATSFAAALQAKVVDAYANPLAGVTVTFVAPPTGASATFSGASSATAVTNSAGIAISPIPAANATSGSYKVTASVPGLTSASFNLTNSPASSTSSATYAGSDSVTIGNWTGQYGANGQLIPNDSSNEPAYATVTFSNDSLYTWATSTTDPRALQVSAGSSSRIASTYYNSKAFTVDLNLSDGNSHKISLYLCDWDGKNSRTEIVTIVDAATQAVLSTQNISAFSAGVYQIWTIKGHVQIKVANNGGANAVLNALFFDPPASQVASSATFAGSDKTTIGNWGGTYGGDGELIPNDLNHAPSYATFTFSNDNLYTWTTSTTDPRALQFSPGSTSRIASTYYNSKGFAVDLNLTDGNSHKISLYLCDWDGKNLRAEIITIVDAVSQTVLSTQNISSFSAGIYQIWTIKGHVQIKVTNNGGTNAILNGIFFN